MDPTMGQKFKVDVTTSETRRYATDMVSRRRFVATMTGGLLGVPLSTGAQQAGKVYRVGFLWHSPAVFPDAIAGFRQRLRELGWVEGRNLAVESRWTEGRDDLLHEMAQELVRLKVDVIFAPASTYAGAAKGATSTIPIVFATHADPVGGGHVATLARPGGNITGLTVVMTETNVKALELLKEVIPGIARVAVLWNPLTPSHKPGLAAVELAGPALGLRVLPIAVRSATEFDSAFMTIVREGAGGALFLSAPLFNAGATPLVELALKYKVPTMFGHREHAQSGGLLSYGADRVDQFRRAATYVDKVLKGAKPADLPVERAAKFELVVNLKTAKALGLTVPQSVLLQAHQIIK